MSQKVAKPFVWINLISFCFFPVGGYYIIYWSNWGISGFGLFKFIVESLNCIGLCWAMKRYGHEESLKRESIKEVFNAADMKQYMKDFGKILAGWYASYFGLEVNTTQCGIALGENNGLMAKKYGFMGFILATGYSIVGGILIICLSGQIAEMFTEVPEVIAPLKWQITLMGICTIFAGSGATGATMWRTINKSGYYSYLMMVNQVLISTTISCFGLFYWKLGAAGVGYAFIVSWVSTYIFTVWYMVKRVDWNYVGAKTN